MHAYEVRPRKDHRGANLISDALPFGRLWYTQVLHAIGYAEFYSRSHDAVIRVYDKAGNVIKTQHRKGQVQRLVTRYPHHFTHVLRRSTKIRAT